MKIESNVENEQIFSEEVDDFRFLEDEIRIMEDNDDRKLEDDTLRLLE